MPNLLPSNYMKKPQKRKRYKYIYNRLISQYKYTHVIGLAGPSCNSWCKNFTSFGINTFEIWENDPATAKKQARTIKYSKARLRIGDIIQANPNRVKTLYECDFTLGVYRSSEYIARFKNNFLMTFCIRKIGTERTIAEFFRIRDEVIISITDVYEEITHKIIKTNVGEYIYATYRDLNGPPMCCIAKL